MPREELYLQDIVKSVDDIRRFLDGIEEAKFLCDEILQNAVLMKLIVIGEAAARISDEIRKNYSQIEWKPIVGFRNIAVHAYFPVKWNIVWETVTNDLLILREQIAQILQDDFPDFELRHKS
ncbi:MAG: DUF86 domain-containing protein [Pyrinomonadaceae bacterium]|nr:DUF86 domain-containing protein [Pyrinomonadaceae bacterium]